MTSSAGEPYSAEMPALRAALAAHSVQTEIRPTGCAWGTTSGSDLMLVCRKEPM